MEHYLFKNTTAAGQKTVTISGLMLLALLAFMAADTRNFEQGMLMLVGGVLGLVLYHAQFGFTSAWRIFLTEKRSAGLRAQMVMLAIAVVLFFPALDAGEIFGRNIVGSAAPASTSVAVGAFLFGIGMQLGNGCASGTLFTLGGGSVRMLVVLFGFVAGSLLGTYHIYWWWSLPSLGVIRATDSLGLYGGLAANIAVFAGIFFLVRFLEKRHHGSIKPIMKNEAAPNTSVHQLLRGPWPLVWAALALALLNYLTLYLSGRPWGVTWAFTLWGAKGATALGIDIFSWPYWSGRQAIVGANILYDKTSVMNFGILLGALIAASLAGKFNPVLKTSLRGAVIGLVGGLMLGYGARLAYGCNIGAFFSGIASGSLHGWLWLAAALPGNWLGIKLKRFLRR